MMEHSYSLQRVIKASGRWLPPQSLKDQFVGERTSPGLDLFGGGVSGSRLREVGKGHKAP